MNISEFFYAFIRGGLTFVKQAIASFRVWPFSVTYSQFLDACDTGDLTVVEQGLTSPELREIVSNNIDSLVMAANNGHLAVVNRLLEIDSVSAFGKNALRGAAINGHLAVLNRLLEIDTARANAAFHGNYLLRCAARNGHLAVVNRLLEIDSVRANVAAERNHALQLAAKFGQLAVVNRLLEFDTVRANAAADDNRALRWAIYYNEYDIAARLLKEPAVLDYIKVNRPHFTKDHKEFFEILKNDTQARFLLPSVLSEQPTKLPPEIVTKIVTYSSHDVMCGKSTCQIIPKDEQLTGERACPIIYEFTKKHLKRGRG